ncbi:MAG: glycosyltransferase 87 family protein, partial [bacterium]|nr:glycosyltransferase 87 family protein [bacterium]
MALGIGFWVVTRLLLLVLTTREWAGGQDLVYYFESLSAGQVSGAFLDAMPEYPLPAMLTIAIPFALAGGSFGAFAALFVGMMVALDAALSFALWRARGRLGWGPFLVWGVLVTALGSISYLRFDLVPTVLAGAALLLAAARPSWSGAAVALGAAMKLWPAALLPAVVVRRGSLRPALFGVAVAGAALVAATVAAAGVDRLLSPLSHQTSRGLQIESVWATPLMLAHSRSPGMYEVRLISEAMEIDGPGAGLLRLAASGAM